MSDAPVTQGSKPPPRGRRARKLRECSICGRTFAKNDHLERHIRSHTKEKPFKCTICGRKYGRNDTLLRHQNDHREDGSTTAKLPRGSSISVGSEHPPQPPVSNDMPEEPGMVSPQAQSLALDGAIDPALDVTSLSYATNETVYHAIQPDSGVAKMMYADACASDLISSNLDPAIEGFDLEAQFPSWLVDGDFSADILDTPLVNSIAELRPSRTESSYAPFGTTCYKPVPDTKRLWFTAGDNGQEGAPESGPATPPASQVEVDDTYRQTLHQSLQIRSQHEQSLPSADFLNLCVRSYFARFHPVFPVVHAPTFRPSQANSMVLLSICSVGSLFTGSTHAIRQGVQIFEWLHKAVLANWDRLISRGTDERISLIQTAIIGQTFGLLSGEPEHLAIVDTFNGTLISWARRLGTFKTKTLCGLDLNNISSYDLDRKWREWAKNEELIRIALSVHIHDAELATIFHHEPFLRHNSRQLPVAASKQTFMAARPEDWRLSYLDDPSNFETAGSTPASVDARVDFDILAMPSNSHFTAYTVLDGICVNIMENRISACASPSTMEEISMLLTTFYRRFLQGTATLEADSMDMCILWHSAYMSISADFDLLERSIGREGSSLSAADRATVTNWANSDQAKRCVIHGTMVQKKVENLPLGSEPAIHVPRAMFRAAIAWFCYTHFGVGGDAPRGMLLGSLDFPEFKLLEVNPALVLFQANGYKHGRPTTTEMNAVLCGLTDLLRRIGHWEIARRFADILGALLYNEAG
ncbi:hypothetical protein A1O1_04622 [Capronia coronata CBS 617.96]|uniref:C2H2-type domain-containing protein n=1 Tax=Capronia coronata CBS 617.96 TaxID=1182541 RepID=W9Y4E3_9EURO|nr:uncharacterized protein A1O1_04622 [Capronia coronata CBS 617.96]EXJ87697.1 hypothetical protein A1O1_04622 [Capronia coronata CBS 617.96]